MISSNKPFENLTQGNIDGYREFQRLLTYQRLVREHPLRNNIYAFNASRTRFYPYQFKPLLKFLDSPKNRLLIADEVGLGKTIEACLIMTELRARQYLKRILVVCPANLRQKWQFELKRRFGESFEILVAKDFRAFLASYQEDPDSSELQGIISLESVRQRSILEMLEDIRPTFDLVIVDEAHHMRNFGTLSRRAGIQMGLIADAMLFLTATPIHLGNENLYSLLNILDDEEFPDQDTAGLRIRQNEPLVKAQICLGQIPPNVEAALDFLDRSRRSPWIKGNPLLPELENKLHLIGQDSDGLRAKLLEAQRDLAELNLLGHIFTRTKKKEVHTKLASRKAYALKVELTNRERGFYEAVTDFVRLESERRFESPLIQQWILNMPQRRVTSSIPAMVEFYRSHQAFRNKDSSEDLSEIDFELDPRSSDSLEEARNRLATIVSSWPANEPDSKYEKLIAILKALQDNEATVKVMIFSFFKDTLRYLSMRLSQDGLKNLTIHGDVPPSQRPILIDKFRDDPTYQILLSSRVGSEGLDFQFCDTLFNYDLPWNPMEVEQRIGRLDRIGQKSEVIRIYNFWIEGTIEQRILQRLYDRIGIFERSIGELEMILGDVLAQLEREIFSNQLNPEEEQDLIEQRLMAIENRLADIRKLENESAKFIGTDQYFDQEVQTIQERRRFVTAEQLRRFLVDFIKVNCSRTRLSYDFQAHVGVLHPDEEFKSILQKHTTPGELARLLAAGPEGVPITFNSQVAFDEPAREFVNVLHPVVQGITEFYTKEQELNSNAHHVVLQTNRLKVGFYFYFVFRLSLTAARGQNTLEMVILKDNFELACSNSDAEIILGEMIEKGEDPTTGGVEISPEAVARACEEASRIFLERESEIRATVKKNNDRFVDRRLQSVRTHYKKLLQNNRDRLLKAQQASKDERYLRLLRGTINRLNSELEHKENRLQTLRSVAVEYREISAGILEVAEK